MSYRYEFTAEVRDGVVSLPAEIAGRLRAKGIRTVRAVLTSLADEADALAARGIDEATIERTAACQHYDADVAMMTLAGEGAAAGTALAHRLDALLCNAPEAQ